MGGNAGKHAGYMNAPTHAHAPAPAPAPTQTALAKISAAEEAHNLYGPIRGILDQIRALVVHDQASLDLVTNVVRYARDMSKAIDARRKYFTDPLLEAKRRLDDEFRGPLRALDEVQACAKAKMQEFEARNREEREAAMRATAAQLAAGTIPTAPMVAPIAATGAWTRYVWDFEVIDETLVERGLCSPDPAKIKTVLSAYTADQTPHPIPGVRVFQKPITTVR